VQSEVGQHKGYEYSRSGNPTRTALETCLAALEGGRTGLAFASGLAAEDCLLRTVTSPGGHVVIPDDAYGGTYRLFSRVLERWGVAHTPVSLADLDAVRAAMRPETSLIWCETPTNPLLGIADIAGLAQIARDGGARSRWTTPSPAPTCSSRWPSAPTSSCTPRPSTSAATPTSSAAPW
jgi:cystathionine gamma-synthase